MKLLCPWHPVRDGAHFDRAEDRRTDPAALQDVLHAADRLIVTHVLIDAERDAGFLATLDHVLRVLHRHGERLLREDAAQVFLLRRLAKDVGLQVGRAAAHVIRIRPDLLTGVALVVMAGVLGPRA